MIFSVNPKFKFFYSVMLVVYASLAVFSVLTKSIWVIDNLLAILFLTFMFFISRWLFLGWTGFVLFNVVLFMHNLGTFGAYRILIGFIAWDNIMHFFGAFVAAYIIFDFISQKLHIRNRKRVRRTVVDEHKVILIFLVMSCVIFLGTLIEMLEFGGYMFLESGEGLLFPSDRETEGRSARFTNQYIDTLEDIFVNTLGAIVGVFFFYNLRYKKDCWIC